MWASWLPVFWTLHQIGWLSLHHLVLFLELWSVLSFESFFFCLSWLACYIVRGKALGILKGGATHVTVLWHCMWGRVWEGIMPLALLLAGFQSLHLLPRSILGPSGADSWVSGFVYILGPCGSLQWTLLWDWEFLPLLLPPQNFIARGSEALFLPAGTLGCMVYLAPQLFFQVYPNSNVSMPNPPAILPTHTSSSHLSVCHLCLSYPSLPLLPVWMNVSSLTPWLSNFHTVWFSGSSVLFLFLSLVLSFFWLCEEAKCIYLCLHLGLKSTYWFLSLL